MGGTASTVEFTRYPFNEAMQKKIDEYRSGIRTNATISTRWLESSGVDKTSLIQLLRKCLLQYPELSHDIQGFESTVNGLCRGKSDLINVCDSFAEEKYTTAIAYAERSYFFNNYRFLIMFARFKDVSTCKVNGVTVPFCELREHCLANYFYVALSNGKVKQTPNGNLEFMLSD